MDATLTSNGPHRGNVGPALSDGGPCAGDEYFLLFLHIEKTAGTTLRSIVDRQYGRDAVLTYYNQPSRQLIDNLPYVLSAAPRKRRALIGHFEFGAHEKLPLASPYITVLRDPIRRAVSAYHETLKTRPEKLARADGSIMDIEEAMSRYPDEYRNHQARMLTAAPNGIEADWGCFETARRHICEHFQMVGLSERFIESMLLLGKQLAWRPCLWGNLNPGPANPNVAPRIREALREANRVDQMLYDWAEAKFAEAVDAEGDAFKEAFAELQDALAARAAAGRSRGDAEIVKDTDLPRVSAYWRS